MLSFKQGDTTITITNTGELMSATRFINLRICRIMTKVDGTVGDLAKKVDRIYKLDDELFEEFARIQEEAEDDN